MVAKILFDLISQRIDSGDVCFPYNNVLRHYRLQVCALLGVSVLGSFSLGVNTTTITPSAAASYYNTLHSCRRSLAWLCSLRMTVLGVILPGLRLILLTRQ